MSDLSVKSQLAIERELRKLTGENRDLRVPALAGYLRRWGWPVSNRQVQRWATNGDIPGCYRKIKGARNHFRIRFCPQFIKWLDGRLNGRARLTTQLFTASQNVESVASGIMQRLEITSPTRRNLELASKAYRIIKNGVNDDARLVRIIAGAEPLPANESRFVFKVAVVVRQMILNGE